MNQKIVKHFSKIGGTMRQWGREQGQTGQALCPGLP